MALRHPIAESMNRLADRNITMDKLAVDFNAAYIFGSGLRAIKAKETLTNAGVQVVAFFDNNLWRQDELIGDIPIKQPAELLVLPRLPVVVCCDHTHKVGIGFQLTRLGVNDIYYIEDSRHDIRPPIEINHNIERLDALYSVLDDEPSKYCLAGILKAQHTGRSGFVRMSNYQQCKHPLVKATSGDVILYAGGYDGQTAIAMSSATNHTCRIYCFEPEENLFGMMQANIRAANTTGIVAINKGIHSESGVLCFHCDNFINGSGSIATDGLLQIETTSIDDFVEANNLPRLDMISLDVEGSELEAIRGAANSIKRFKPKLQISIYHTHSHLWEAFESIREIVDGYRYFVGHHTHSFNETMLYAVHEGR